MATDIVNPAPLTSSDARHNYEELTKKLLQLDALLTMTYGNNAENFTLLADGLRDNYMWACSELATDCVTLSSSLWPAICQAKEAAHG